MSDRDAIVQYRVVRPVAGIRTTAGNHVRAVLTTAYEQTPEGDVVPGVTWQSDPARLRVEEASDG